MAFIRMCGRRIRDPAFQCNNRCARKTARGAACGLTQSRKRPDIRFLSERISQIRNNWRISCHFLLAHFWTFTTIIEWQVCVSFTRTIRSSVDVRVSLCSTIPVRAIWRRLLSLVVHPALAQIPSFSGAEGYGGTFSGSAPAGGWFSNATVYHVTNLNDSGAGSLRGAFVENSANKIIVFDVAGTIQLTSGSLDIKNLSNYYIAGQTAPGPVTIYGDTTQITHSSDKNNTNVILRYLSFRKGNGQRRGRDHVCRRQWRSRKQAAAAA